MARGAGEVAGVTALGFVWGTALALLLFAAVFWLLAWRLRRQAAGEQASLRPAPLQLVDGVTALAGTVEADAAPVTVTVEVGRAGETSRTIEARPFVLRLACGTAVRVEPGPAPVLRDDLGASEPLADGVHRRTATLAPGEQVFVRGALRVRGIGVTPELAGSERAVLSAGRRRMVLSTEALSGALAGRASGHEFRVLMLVLTLVAQFVLYIGVYVQGLRFVLADGEAPTISLDIYFWVLLIAGSMILGAIGSAWAERPWHALRKLG